MISFVFIIVFTQEENVSSTETESHDRILQGSLFITPMGHFFVLLGLYHPILMCLTMTMERSKARILKYITIALMVSPLIFSIAGDIMLILEYKQDFQTDDSIHSSLILKALGSLGFLALVFLYFICVFLYFFINLNIEEKHGVKLNSLIFQLLGLGLLAALRFTYDVVICLINFFEKPSLELNIYYVLAVAGGILLILLAYLSNLSKLKIHSESPV